MSKPKRTIEQYTFDIEEIITSSKNEFEGIEYEDFRKNNVLVGYAERILEKIGEAISQIQKLDKEILYKVFNDKSYWENIKGTRNRIVHEYWGTDTRTIFMIMKSKELTELLEHILKLRELSK